MLTDVEIRCESSPQEPANDMELTGALLRSVASGGSRSVIRVFRPGPTVAFGRGDALCDGFELARRAARSHGFTPVVRHAGGHAVAYGLDSVVLELMRPEAHLFGGIEKRFEELAALLQASLAQLGVELQVGELPNEYCPGRFSLHIPGGPKVAGVAQRVIKGASLTTAVLTVGSGDEIRAVTAAVYAELDLPLDPGTVGAITDRCPDISSSAAADAVVSFLSAGVRQRSAAGEAAALSATD